jgi:hypothetical protein
MLRACWSHGPTPPRAILRCAELRRSNLRIEMKRPSLALFARSGEIATPRRTRPRGRGNRILSNGVSGRTPMGLTQRASARPSKPSRRHPTAELARAKRSDVEAAAWARRPHDAAGYGERREPTIFRLSGCTGSPAHEPGLAGPPRGAPHLAAIARDGGRSERSLHSTAAFVGRRGPSAAPRRRGGEMNAAGRRGRP